MAVVRDLRDVRPPATTEELEQFETDTLAGVVLAEVFGLDEEIAVR
ncbi:hypothetical protein ACFY84_32835 [Streptomyces sp. NPDC012438]